MNEPLKIGDTVKFQYRTGWPDQPEITVVGEIIDVPLIPRKPFVVVLNKYGQRFFPIVDDLQRISDDKESPDETQR